MHASFTKPRKFSVCAFTKSFSCAQRVRARSARLLVYVVIFTDGALLEGVRFRNGVITTQTVVMRSITGTVRWIAAEHRQFAKFHLG